MGKVSEWVLRMQGLIKNWDSMRLWTKNECDYGINNFCNGRANNTGIGKRDKKNEDREPCNYFINGVCTKKKG